MTISYNWLSDYLPEKIEPEKLSKILTSIGLEVETLEKFESIKGGLDGLVIGEVLTNEPHENADKLKVTTVNIGAKEPLQIVCGAPNVAAGQKVIVATPGTTIHPTTGEPVTMKVAKIRGIESHGMICAEDEIGIGTDHAGVMVLPNDVKAGTPAAEYFKPYTDLIFEIGLTPNRMDAMSHLGVAKDVCAYLTQHNKKETKPVSPFTNAFKVDNRKLPIKVTIEDINACRRYAGVSITNVTVKESPQWLKNRLLAIGLRPINNIVDITNYVLHETGQPLHAFDADAIEGREIVVKTLPGNTLFISLDEKERKLGEDDLMICNTQDGMCIAGVFGGVSSGVKDTTTNIFLESAWFNPVNIRRTSMRFGLRTDAAMRFEKGVDISNTVNVLKRTALLIKEVAGGSISSDIVDAYPNPPEKTQIALKYHYLKKLSGKNYHPDAIKRILVSLGFDVLKEGMDEVLVAAPFSKPDISLAADIVEEIVRIDGLDNIEIPSSITISPAVETLGLKDALKNKIAGYLTGLGFHEIMTNSITNSNYFSEEVLSRTVKMINSLSAELNVLRPSMLETGLETIAHNVNRRNTNLQLFEFGKTYHEKSVGNYNEEEHLSLYITGKNHEDNWKEKGQQFDFFYAKGVASSILNLCKLSNVEFKRDETSDALALTINFGRTTVGRVTEVEMKDRKKFDITQNVFFVDFHYDILLKMAEKEQIVYKEVPRFPSVQRDVAMIVNKDVSYDAVRSAVKKENLHRLVDMELFDVFENEKLGANKKSMAVSFTFLDEEKTLTDKEVDSMVNKLMNGFEKELNAEIRK